MRLIPQRRGRRDGKALAAGAAGLLALAAALMAAGSAHAAVPTSSGGSATCPSHVNGATQHGRFGGLAHPVSSKAACQVHTSSDAAIGTPPLLFHGGPVMGTKSTGAVVVTPIFWNPAGHSIDSGYKSILNTYLRGVAGDSGKHTNVYSTLNEYYGANGNIRYRIKFGTPVSDTNPLPANGCTLESVDTANIYADGTGYDACLDDSQVINETESIVSAKRLARDYGHIYVMFLPKHVESCFYAGATATSNNFCTINHLPSAAYCAYHSQSSSGTVYANMPFPIYDSAVGYTCGSEFDLGAVQAPNGNADADTEVSPTSHEIMEAITDPDVSTGWYDASGYENGDECAYVYGTTQGTAGALYNQVIRQRHYLTQEEFSNQDFAATGGGCLQSE